MVYHFYVQQTDKDGAVIADTTRHLEGDFAGLSYLSIKGLEIVGKPKNIYEESYAEHDGTRVYHPSDNEDPVTRETTKIALDLVIQGANRRSVYNSLCDYLRGNRLYYWDTARHKKVWLILNEEVNPEDDTLKGVKYIRATFNFTNIWGYSKTCNDNGVVV